MTDKFVEIQYDSDNIVEYVYKGNSNDSDVLELKNKLFTHFSEEVNKDLCFSYDMISYHSKNNTTYEEDAIVVVFDEKCPHYLREEFEVENFNSLDFYAIKYYLSSKKRVLKTYDADMYKYELPQLPYKSAIGNQFGIGRSHGLDKNYRDVYFFNSHDFVVQSYWGDWVPEIEEPIENPATKCYGITYTEEDKNVLKVKRYLFPFHFEMSDLSCL